MALSQQELQRRREGVDSTLGTHAMEGLFPDAATMNILRRYETGELTLEQFSAAMDAHARAMLAALQPLAGAA